MKLVKDLQELPPRAFDSLIALTFNADLPWFEFRLLGRLQARGVRRILLLADERPLSSTLSTYREQIRQAGQTYAVEGLRAIPSFHPKLLLLTGERQARLYVGSGNLSRGGMERNRELFECWDARADDKRVPEVFHDALKFLGKLVEKHFPLGPPAHVTDSLNAARGAACFMRPPEPSPSVKLRLGGVGERLADHLKGLPTPAHTLRMCAPYFDPEGAQAVELAGQLQATGFTVITDLRMTNLTREALAAIQQAGGRLEVVDSREERRVHAKLLHAAGEGWQLAVHGSANLSKAAWQGHNVELVVFRTGPAADELAQRLDELPTREPSEAELSALGETSESEDEPQDGEPPPPGPRVTSAHWFGARILLRTEARQAPGLRVELAQGKVQHVAEPQPHEGGLSVEVPQTVSPESPLLARLLAGGEQGPWCVVHDPRELNEQVHGRPRHDEELLDHLAADPDDPDAAEALLRFYTDLLHERAQEAVRQQAAAPKARDSERSPSRPPDNVFLRDEDFQGTPPAEPPARTGGPVGLESPRLLMRLLFGGVQHEDADAREAEGPPSAEEPPPDGPWVRLEEATSGKPASKRPRRNLTETVIQARAAYLRLLKEPELERRGPVRLLQDAQALCTGFQRAFRTGEITIETFVAEQSQLLRALLGRASAPLPQALREVPEEQREELWTRAPILPGVMLLVYNVCLADFARGRHRRADPGFPSVAPVLWIRHVLRHAPAGSLEGVMELAHRQVPRLQRHDALWLGDTLRSAHARVGFTAFLERMVREARAVEHLDMRLRAGHPKLECVQPLTPERSEVNLLGVGRDGTLAPGFAQLDERDEEEGGGVERRAQPLKRKLPPPRACLIDGAFQSMAPHALAQGVRERMHQVESTRFVSLDEALEAFEEDAEVLEALAVLEQIISPVDA